MKTLLPSLIAVFVILLSSTSGYAMENMRYPYQQHAGRSSGLHGSVSIGGDGIHIYPPGIIYPQHRPSPRYDHRHWKSHHKNNCRTIEKRIFRHGRPCIITEKICGRGHGYRNNVHHHKKWDRHYVW